MVQFILVSNMVMILVVHRYNMLVGRGKNKGDVIQADQVLHGNRIPGELGIVVVGGDAEMKYVVAALCQH
jgi:hypothetical protein